MMQTESSQTNIKLYTEAGDNIGSVSYVQHMGDDVTIVNSARVSFGVHHDEMQEGDEKLINYLIKHKHTSTLEHNVVTLRFKVPLFVRSQHHRHRTWSFNEISRRYTNIDLSFYEPELYRTQHKSNRQASNPETLINPIVNFALSSMSAKEAVEEHTAQSLELYDELIATGVCKEQARGVLPQNMYTEYYGTTNLNNLLKFIELRNHVGAQWEIQQVAKACESIAEQLWPSVIRSYKNNKTK